MNRLKDKVAIVTGSTSGIGIAIAELYAAEGAIVTVCGRRAEKGEAVAQEIREAGGRAVYHYMDLMDPESIEKLMKDTAEKYGRIDILEKGEAVAQEIREAGGRAVYHYMDLMDPESIEKLMKDTAEKYGRIDILVNNAANASPKDGTVEEVTLEQWNEVFDSNLRGTFVAVKAALPFMKEHGGSIINIGSMAACGGDLQGTAYAASKAGVDMLTKDIALQSCPPVHERTWRLNYQYWIDGCLRRRSAGNCLCSIQSRSRYADKRYRLAVWKE